ncbi:MAG: hypothetical protein WBH66_09890 [Rectinemataceae bacterium]
MKNKLFRLLTCLILVFAALSGCGLPTVTFLYPPQNFFFSGNATLSVQNTNLNYDASEGANQTFKGIEIFYHIYQDSTTASSMLAMLGTLSDSYDGNPDRFIEVVTGTSYRFVRLRNSVDRIQPLLALSAADENIYSIQLNGDSNWTLNDGLSTYDVIRTINTISSDDRFYIRDFNVDDDDYSGTASSSRSLYYIVFFAVSYGQDQVTVGQNVYSMPYIPSSFATY